MKTTHTSGATNAADTNSIELIDALNGVFGKHEGARASHAKGFCTEGIFTPAPEAAKFSQAKLLSEISLKAVIRFSVGGGNPKISDKSRSVRGMAARIFGTNEIYDLVLISEPVFFASTPASFISFLKARQPDPETKMPDQKKIEEHNKIFPDGKLQPSLLASHAAPASYATTPYYSNHAFKFIASNGDATWARIIAEPVLGTKYLTPDEEQSLSDNFLADDLQNKLETGHVAFNIYAQLKGPNDSIHDPASKWADEFGKLPLGKLEIINISKHLRDEEVFLPTNLPKGIEASDDPILQVRAAAYAISKSRRTK